jgi:hypothetical protein
MRDISLRPSKTIKECIENQLPGAQFAETEQLIKLIKLWSYGPSHLIVTPQ